MAAPEATCSRALPNDDAALAALPRPSAAFVPPFWTYMRVLCAVSALALSASIWLVDFTSWRWSSS